MDGSMAFGRIGLLLFLGFLFVFLLGRLVLATKFLAEFLNTTHRVDELLFACIEGV